MQLLLWLLIQVEPALRQFCNMPVQKWRAFLPDQVLVLQVVAPGVRRAAQQNALLPWFFKYGAIGSKPINGDSVTASAP